MRAVIQRVTRASVTVDGRIAGSVERGFLVLVGVAVDDTDADADSLAQKIAGLRLFNDAAGAMNLGLGDIGGAVLVISQFTLLGDVRKGRRPSFAGAARGELAKHIYERFVVKLRDGDVPVETGVFGADMAVELVNDGPVTILLDTKRAF